MTGGQYDVDVVLEDPNGREIYKEVKKQLDSFSYKVFSAFFPNYLNHFTD